MQQSGSVNLSEDNLLKLIYRFSVPTMLSMFVTASYNIVDTFFVGKLGSEAIAALSIAYPLQMILAALGIGTGIGAASFISRSAGAGDRRRAEAAVGQVFLLALLFLFLTLIIGLFFLEPLLLLAGADSEILPLTREYMGVITTGAVFIFLMMSLNRVVRAQGFPLLSMKVIIASGLLNIALDPVFIFGLGLGVKGAAIATVTAQAGGAVLLIFFLCSAQSGITLQPQYFKPDFMIIANIYKIGVSGMLLSVSKNITIIITNIILIGYGHFPVAIMGILFRLSMLATLPVLGFTEGLLPIMGYNHGARKTDRVYQTLKTGIALTTAIFLITGVLYFLMPGLFMGFFTDEAALIAGGSGALRLMALPFPVLGFLFMSGTYYQSIGKGIPSLFFSLLREVLLFIPVLLIMAKLWEVSGVWLARPVSDFLAFLIAFLYILFEFKSRKTLSAGSVNAR